MSYKAIYHLGGARGMSPRTPNPGALLKEEVVQTFVNNDKLAFLNEVLEAAAGTCEYEASLEAYNKGRDKVCEICASRAITKKLKANSGTRSSIVTNCKKVIAEIGGVLPPRLSLLLDAAVKA